MSSFTKKTLDVDMSSQSFKELIADFDKKVEISMFIERNFALTKKIIKKMYKKSPYGDYNLSDKVIDLLYEYYSLNIQLFATKLNNSGIMHMAEMQDVIKECKKSFDILQAAGMITGSFMEDIKTVTDYQLKEKKCCACHIPIKKVLICSRCMCAKYCSKECQKSNWKMHKPNCKLN
jgi:hypothetical protein